MRADRRPVDPEPEAQTKFEAVRASRHDALSFEAGELSSGLPMVAVVLDSYRGRSSFNFPAENAPGVALAVMRAARWPEDSGAVIALRDTTAGLAPLLQRRDELAARAGYTTYNACPVGITELIDDHIELESRK